MEGLNFVGAGLIVRAALGIGIGGSAMDAIARQPEASGKIQTAMLIAAALIEELVSLHYLLLIKIQKTIVTTVGCNYCFIKLNIIIDT
jgi:F-type H+-transporting ATPase subunit c